MGLKNRCTPGTPKLRITDATHAAGTNCASATPVSGWLDWARALIARVWLISRPTPAYRLAHAGIR
jgi:hypothetical protein